MTPKRPQRLVFTGNVFPDGRPERFIAGVPAEDIDAEQTDALTQDQLSQIRSSGLYREIAQSAPTKKTRTKAATARPDDPGEPTDTGDEPTATAEPVTESEG